MQIDLIVSRHSAAVEWLRKQGITAPVLESATAADVSGKIVAGNLPLHLAAKSAAVVAIEFLGAPPRGREYGVAEMEASGAHLAVYVVGQAGQPDMELGDQLRVADSLQHAMLHAG